MRTISVEELEADLRGVLRGVRAGEVLRVVEDGEVVAEVARPPAPPAPEPIAPDDLEARLQALAAAGHIQRARQPLRGWRWRPRGLGLPPGLVQQILDEGREDRWP